VRASVGIHTKGVGTAHAFGGTDEVRESLRWSIGAIGRRGRHGPLRSIHPGIVAGPGLGARPSVGAADDGDVTGGVLGGCDVAVDIQEAPHGDRVLAQLRLTRVAQLRPFDRGETVL